MATVTIIEKQTIRVHDANDTFIGERIQGFANVLLDDYYETTGLTLDADAFGLTGLQQLFIQPLDANVDGTPLVFNWDPSDGTLMAWDATDGSAIADAGLDDLNVRVIFFGY